ncbi:MAG TPA: DinB family protein [Gemmatimonadales bacterium]|nr:DinB family protein [Gemmatimonadales bacterium]
MTQLVIPEAIAVLERTPATLRALLLDLPAPWTTATEGPGTWSPYDVIGHLVHGERTDWIPRLRLMLSEAPERTFAPFDREAMLHESLGKSLGDLLDEFAALRAANLAVLRAAAISSAECSRTAVHPSLGQVSLGNLLATWVAHDLGHLVQVARVMATRYREEVGPWRAYLRVLDG